MIAGCLLGLLLLVETVFTYIFVSHRLIEEEAQREANRIYSTLIETGRNSNLIELNQYAPLLDKERRREPNRVAWIRLRHDGWKDRGAVWKSGCPATSCSERA